MKTLLIVLIAFLLVSCQSQQADELEFESADKVDQEAGFPAEMKAYRQQYENSAIQYVSVSATPAKTKPWDSKFLGLPYLLKENVYPTGADGKPLQLLAQINFEEMPALKSFPTQGVLQFYISPFDADDHYWGSLSYSADPWVTEDYFRSLFAQDHFKVIYQEDIIKDTKMLTSKNPDFSDGYMPMDSEARLNFTSSIGYVTHDDYRFSEYYGQRAYDFFEQWLENEDEVSDAYYDHVYPKGQAWIDGYGTFAQGDPREIKPNEDWVLLLEIDSSFENELDILWGDGGVGTFFIRREDLENKDFSNVLYYWDSY